MKRLKPYNYVNSGNSFHQTPIHWRASINLLSLTKANFSKCYWRMSPTQLINISNTFLLKQFKLLRLFIISSWRTDSRNVQSEKFPPLSAHVRLQFYEKSRSLFNSNWFISCLLESEIQDVRQWDLEKVGLPSFGEKFGFFMKNQYKMQKRFNYLFNKTRVL